MDVAPKNAPQGAKLTDRVMVINTNIAAQTGARFLAESSNSLSKSLARLSSGSRLVSPEDDAAGMAVSMRFDAQINRTAAAASNVRNSISFAQTQDGFLKKLAKALDRMGELAVLAQDVTKTDPDRVLYDKEYGKLSDYVRSTTTKDFNGVQLFSGTTLNVTVDSEGSSFAMAGINLGGTPYGSSIYMGASFSSIFTAVDAATALSNTKNAIIQLSSDRSVVASNLSVLRAYDEQNAELKDNLTAANSRIKDVDVAGESTQFARFNILVQAGTAMLAQANSGPQSVLRLLQ